LKANNASMEPFWACVKANHACAKTFRASAKTFKASAKANYASAKQFKFCYQTFSFESKIFLISIFKICTIQIFMLFLDIELRKL
jgi:hypothetical protein